MIISVNHEGTLHHVGEIETGVIDKDIEVLDEGLEIDLSIEFRVYKSPEGEIICEIVDYGSCVHNYEECHTSQ